MERIRLDTLGGLAIVRGLGDAQRVTSGHHKRHAVLAYLAVEQVRGAHSRDSLMALFWPDSDHRHARDALNQLLRSLRREFGAAIFENGGGNGVAVDPTWLTCDANELLHAVRAGDLDEALTLYQGPFLKGFHLSGTPEFEQWVDLQRDRLRGAARQAATDLAAEHHEAGDVQSAVRSLRRARELSPFDENIVRRLMRLFVEAGENALAVATFDQFAALLDEELGVGPSAETVVLADQARVRVELRSEPAWVTVPPLPESERRGATKRGPRGRLLAAALGAGAAVVVTVAVLTLAGDAPPDAPRLDKTSVLVDQFENLTGDPGLDHLQARATDHVTSGLTYTTFADVVTRGSSLLSRTGRAPPEDLNPRAAALEAGTGTLITGTYSLVGDELRFDAQIVDVASGAVIAVVPPAVGSRDQPLAALERLRDQVMAGIAAHVDPRMEKWARYSSRPPTLEVFRHFVAGLEAHTTLGLEGVRAGAVRALPHFLAAYEADSTFTMAAIWGRWAASNAGNRAVADSLSRHLLARRDRLEGLDRLMVDAIATRTPQENLDVWRRVVEIAPGSGHLKHAAVVADLAGRPEEALEYRRAADPSSGWLYGWFPFFTRYAGSLHRLGHCDEIPLVAEQARASLPESTRERIGLRLELSAHACLGDADRLLDTMERYLTAADRQGWREHFTAFPLADAATSLIAHAPEASGSTFVSEVERFLVQGAEPNPPEPAGFGRPEGDDSPLLALELARLLAILGRYDEGRPILEELLLDERIRGFYRDEAMKAAAVTYAELGALDEVRRIAMEAHEQNADVGRIIDAIAAAHGGRPEEALDFLERTYAPTAVERHALLHDRWLWRPMDAYAPFQEWLDRPVGPSVPHARR